MTTTKTGKFPFFIYTSLVLLFHASEVNGIVRKRFPGALFSLAGEQPAQYMEYLCKLSAVEIPCGCDSHVCNSINHTMPWWLVWFECSMCDTIPNNKSESAGTRTDHDSLIELCSLSLRTEPIGFF